jgi:high-affinity iron transporter
MLSQMSLQTFTKYGKLVVRILLAIAALLVAGVLLWQGITASGNPDPTTAHISQGAAILDTGVLVFREGLECILVLSAMTASMVGSNQSYRRPVAVGAGGGFLAVIATWFIAIAILNTVTAPALAVQAGTGLLAVIVLVIIMNWFFHKVYWTGWISLHNRRKRTLLKSSAENTVSSIFWGLALLGFSSVYREGFEIVLFLQTLRLQVGSIIVGEGVLIGLALTSMVAVLTFFAHRHLPYKKILVLTGVLLGIVMLVMVGEEAQEMQLAGWLSTTNLALPIPPWMGLWFSVFPTVETLIAQVLAAIFVIGSYFLAQYVRVWRPRKLGQTQPINKRLEATPKHDAYTSVVSNSVPKKNAAS